MRLYQPPTGTKGNIEEETNMRGRFSGSITTGAVVVAGVGAVISACIMPACAQAPEASAIAAASTLKTPWGEPDLQGIWTDEFDTPLQRSTKYEKQEFLSQEQRAELDKERRALLDRDQRGERGTEADVAGAYSFAVFLSTKHTGARTSLIVDPPNGRIPPLTPEAQKAAAADRESRRAEPPPRYNTIDLGRIKLDGPEDGALADRCLTGGLPEFGTPFGGSFRRIVQTPSGISMFYDVGQGQGWQRNIVMNGSPHLPGNIRQWYGDSRGHWEGNTLVIDVTNFSPKTDYQGSRENLHVVERWTRTGPTSLEYVVTIEDPTVWTRPWSVKQDFTRQSDQENRVYYEPRCVEGNYGLPGMLHGRRMAESAFAERRGPDPATK
jgi:hypothetical protein